MLVLQPIPHETIWGGKKLKEIFATPLKTIGHLYSVIATPQQSNIILNGEYKERTFFEYIKERGSEFNLHEQEFFPLTIALVEACENLSIQVHPDDVSAGKLENGKSGKNESWYFMKAPDSGRIFNGCKEKESKKLLSALEAGDFSGVDELVIEEGDYVYVEGGTLHALSTGSYLYEIEETSDLTYRIYDFGRLGDNGKPRELHQKQAIEAMKTGLKSDTKKYGEEEIKEKKYSTKRLLNPSYYQNESSVLECLTLLKGKVKVEGIAAAAGMTIILEPKEVITGMEIEEAIVARYC